MRHLFLINPRAGRGTQVRRIYAMAEELRRRHGERCDCLLTGGPGGAERLARQAARSGEEVRLYACGGDGTLHEAVNGAAPFPNAAVTVIPCGTGNDLLKNFGADAARFSDAENLWNGPDFPLDLIDCGGRYCLTIACCGIDAAVAEGVHRFDRLPLLRGRGSYLASAAEQALLHPIARRWTLALDGAEETGDYALAALCNGRYYGGGSMPAPEARMDDGVLQAVVVRAVSRGQFLRLFGPYSAGNWRTLPPELIRVVPARTLTVRAEEDSVTCLDGECARRREVTMGLAPVRLRFFGPAGCDPNATAR